jgi:hypothetical protein
MDMDMDMKKDLDKNKGKITIVCRYIRRNPDKDEDRDI